MLIIILSITGLLRTILILIMFYLMFNLISRLIRMNKRLEQHEMNFKKQKEQEGDMILRFNKKGERIKDKTKDDFAEYEEVD